MVVKFVCGFFFFYFLEDYFVVIKVFCVKFVIGVDCEVLEFDFGFCCEF